MQGVAGAFAGALSGAAFALLNSIIRFGAPALGHLSLTSLGVSMGISVAVGFLLSLLGVFYPALVAARMQPVEAMRVEQ
jgi:ABC-type antimicrobial peptide transport system permease subunit